MTQSDKEIAREAVLFASLPDDLAELVLGRATIHTIDSGGMLFLHGDPATYVYVVLDGWIKLFRSTSAGNEAVVGVFTKGQSFGEAAAFRGDVYPVGAEAVTDCRLLRVSAAYLLETMVARPELCVAILGATFRHLHALVAQIEQLKAQTGPQRVAEFLVELCPVSEGACTVTLPYDKALIAGRLGMSPESLSRAFARLRQHGVIVNQYHAAIGDIETLRDYAETDRSEAWSRAQ
ncbi:Crp/Fnr family transcriptional regulator [Oceanibacterium hippocampi]|uniref:Nitrogen fixation regulation protein FixK n=1 Tax=Oceanibacterium hippocampi TaxID=745714 RepID=A0A1Y5TG32_9PROT|nr:Crp/Fnr family transcriptional regulator [Oceanibacterium hippocampi]SLN61079.1 Nitrogen fixation regulation protein FixK [Oceanibacterium hippocampi]